MKKKRKRQKPHKNYLRRKMKPNLKLCHLKLHLHNQRMDKALKRNNKTQIPCLLIRLRYCHQILKRRKDIFLMKRTKIQIIRPKITSEYLQRRMLIKMIMSRVSKKPNCMRILNSWRLSSQISHHLKLVLLKSMSKIKLRNLK